VKGYGVQGDDRKAGRMSLEGKIRAVQVKSDDWVRPQERFAPE